MSSFEPQSHEPDIMEYGNPHSRQHDGQCRRLTADEYSILASKVTIVCSILGLIVGIGTFCLNRVGSSWSLYGRPAEPNRQLKASSKELPSQHIEVTGLQRAEIAEQKYVRTQKSIEILDSQTEKAYLKWQEASQNEELLFEEELISTTKLDALIFKQAGVGLEIAALTETAWEEDGKLQESIIDFAAAWGAENCRYVTQKLIDTEIEKRIKVEIASLEVRIAKRRAYRMNLDPRSQAFSDFDDNWELRYIGPRKAEKRINAQMQEIERELNFQLAADRNEILLRKRKVDELWKLVGKLDQYVQQLQNKHESATRNHNRLIVKIAEARSIVKDAKNTHETLNQTRIDLLKYLTAHSEGS